MSDENQVSTYEPAPVAEPRFAEVVTRTLARELERRRTLDPHRQLDLRTTEDPELIDDAFALLYDQYDPRRFATYGVDAMRAASGIVHLLERARATLLKG